MLAKKTGIGYNGTNSRYLRRKGMEEMEQRHVVIVGAGIMGASLAQVYAQGGWQVSLYNRSQKGLDRARGTVLKTRSCCVHRECLPRRKRPKL